MYPAEIVLPMKAELTDAGFDDMVTAAEVSETLSKQGTTLVVINSVCGCAAGTCRPGVLMAVQSQTLIDNDLYFDEQFDFHFYDLDFCRQAEVKNIELGTWDIAFTHGSKGNCGTDSWRRGYSKYLEKWGD